MHFQRNVKYLKHDKKLIFFNVNMFICGDVHIFIGINSLGKQAKQSLINSLSQLGESVLHFAIYSIELQNIYNLEYV